MGAPLSMACDAWLLPEPLHHLAIELQMREHGHSRQTSRNFCTPWRRRSGSAFSAFSIDTRAIARLQLIWVHGLSSASLQRDTSISQGLPFQTKRK